MTSRTPRQPRTPAMIRTGYDRNPAPPARTPDGSLPGSPRLSAGPDGDIFAEWMAHVDAGRIVVR